MMVKAGGRRLAVVEPPTPDQTHARLYQDVREAVDRRPDDTVKQYAASLHRVWTSGAKTRRSTTTMRRAVLGGSTASATTHLGVPLTYTRGQLQPAGGVETGGVSLDAAREWVAGVVRGTLGPIKFDEGELSVDVTIDAVEVAVGQFANTYTLTPKTANRRGNCRVELLVVPASPPVLYDAHVKDWGSAPRGIRRVLTTLLDATQQLLTRGRLTPCNATYLPVAPNVGTMRQLKEWPEEACHAALFNDKLGAPPPEQLAARVSVVQYDTLSGVASGVVAACDVSPDLFIIGGSPNGKGVHYSVMRVVVDGVRGHYATTATQQREQPLMYYSTMRRQPCRKDGLLSPQLVNLLTGDGSGNVGVDFVDNSTGESVPLRVRTLWADALDRRGVVELKTRDPEQAIGTLIGMAMLQGWSAAADSDAMCLSAVSGEGISVRIKVVYWPTVGPRWMEGVSAGEQVDLSPNREDYYFEYPSELAMDYWMSGLARYVMKDLIVGGSTRLNGLSPVVHAHGLFPLLDHQPALAMPTMDIVLHVGKVKAASRGDAVGVYVYAIGAALCKAGKLMAKYEALDAHVETMDVRGSNSAVARYESLQQSVTRRGDVRTSVRLLARLASQNKIRVFGSGVGTAVEQCTAEHDHHADTSETDKLREVGPVMNPSMLMPDGWDYASTPGDIACANAFASGIVAALPEVGNVDDASEQRMWELIAGE